MGPAAARRHQASRWLCHQLRHPRSRPSPCQRPRRRRRRRTTPSDSPSGLGCCPQGPAGSTADCRRSCGSTPRRSTRGRAGHACSRPARTPAPDGRRSACTATRRSCRCARSTAPAARAGPGAWHQERRVSRSPAPPAAAGSEGEAASGPARAARTGLQWAENCTARPGLRPNGPWGAQRSKSGRWSRWSRSGLRVRAGLFRWGARDIRGIRPYVVFWRAKCSSTTVAWGRARPRR